MPPVIAPSNDFNVGVGPLTDGAGVVGTGLTITAWLSDQRDHSTASPAPEIHEDLSVNLVENGSTGLYEGFIDGAEIDAHLIEASPERTEVWLHRADSTSSWTHPPERCRVYGRRLV